MIFIVERVGASNSDGFEMFYRINIENGSTRQLKRLVIILLCPEHWLRK